MGDIVMRTPGVVRFEIDEAIDGPYFMIGQIYFESAEALEAAVNGPTAGEAWADVPNVTNIRPVMQVSKSWSDRRGPSTDRRGSGEG